MKAAYADPPYLGCGAKHYGDRHEAAAEYDTPEAHKRRILPGQAYRKVTGIHEGNFCTYRARPRRPCSSIAA